MDILQTSGQKNMEQRIYIVYVGLQHTPIFRAINHCLSFNHTELIRTKSYTFLLLWFSIQTQVLSSDSALFLCKHVGWGDQRTLFHLPCCSCVLCRWQLFCYNFITKNNCYLPKINCASVCVCYTQNYATTRTIYIFELMTQPLLTQNPH